MSDLGGTYTIAPTKYVIQTIEFSWDDKRHKYNPKPDVTTYELSKLLILVTYGSIASRQMVSYDWGRFVKENELERHFDEVVN